jgi:hypothetical protein
LEGVLEAGEDTLKNERLLYTNLTFKQKFSIK